MEGDVSMKKYYRERFEAQRRLQKKIAPLMEVNEILERLREEVRELIPSSMEGCILLLDRDAGRYTRPLQCALFDRPVNCQVCKRNRPAIQKAMAKRKGVVVSRGEPILRQDATVVRIGPEAAIPVFVGDEILAVVNVVATPGTRFTKKDFYLLRDFSEIISDVLIRAKKHWEMTQEKIRISQMLTHLSPFVPVSVRNLIEKNPELLNQEKELRDVSVLFLDLEGYTSLSDRYPEKEVNEIIEKIFSSFVDPIHRSRGDINETAGDGLMIIFKDDDPATNAVNAVKSAFDIFDRNWEITKGLSWDVGPINVNIGINSGKALVGLTRFMGSLQTRMTYTASGPVTNVAARLAAHAKGGEILIGEETKRIIEGLWPFHDRGQVQLKGLEQPIRIYALIHPGAIKI
jgi:class 3 adenylate cyclase